MKLDAKLLVESLVWAFTICLLAPIAGGTIILLCSHPVAELGLLYGMATLYYYRRQREREPGRAFEHPT